MPLAQRGVSMLLLSFLFIAWGRGGPKIDRSKLPNAESVSPDGHAEPTPRPWTNASADQKAEPNPEAVDPRKKPSCYDLLSSSRLWRDDWPSKDLGNRSQPSRSTASRWNSIKDMGSGKVVVGSYFFAQIPHQATLEGAEKFLTVATGSVPEKGAVIVLHKVVTSTAAKYLTRAFMVMSASIFLYRVYSWCRGIYEEDKRFQEFWGDGQEDTDDAWWVRSDPGKNIDLTGHTARHCNFPRSAGC
jgi:hypothetical protein